MPDGTTMSIARRPEPKLPVLRAAALAFLFAAGAQGAAVAAPPGAGEDRMETRQRPRAEPLAPEPQARNPARRAPEVDGKREQRPGPPGCPDRGQPLELIV
jgi:hypothetical protein